MAHYAVLNSDNIVTQVFVGRDEDDLPEGISSWESYYSTEEYTVKRTSYNTVGGEHLLGGTPFRKNYAAVGYSYNESLDAFVPPQPFDSWIINEESGLWEAPNPYPEDGNEYVWNEETTSWDSVENSV